MTGDQKLGLICCGLVALVIAAVIGWELKHPCIRYEKRKATCGGNEICTWVGDHGHCMAWSREPEYQCTKDVCVERKP